MWALLHIKHIEFYLFSSPVKDVCRGWLVEAFQALEQALFLDRSTQCTSLCSCASILLCHLLSKIVLCHSPGMVMQQRRVSLSSGKRPRSGASRTWMWFLIRQQPTPFFHLKTYRVLGKLAVTKGMVQNLILLVDHLCRGLLKDKAMLIRTFYC